MQVKYKETLKEILDNQYSQYVLYSFHMVTNDHYLRSVCNSSYAHL